MKLILAACLGVIAAPALGETNGYVVEEFSSVCVAEMPSLSSVRGALEGRRYARLDRGEVPELEVFRDPAASEEMFITTVGSSDEPVIALNGTGDTDEFGRTIICSVQMWDAEPRRVASQIRELYQLGDPSFDQDIGPRTMIRFDVRIAEREAAIFVINFGTSGDGGAKAFLVVDEP